MMRLRADTYSDILLSKSCGWGLDLGTSNRKHVDTLLYISLYDDFWPDFPDGRLLHTSFLYTMRYSTSSSARRLFNSIYRKSGSLCIQFKKRRRSFRSLNLQCFRCVFHANLITKFSGERAKISSFDIESRVTLNLEGSIFYGRKSFPMAEIGALCVAVLQRAQWWYSSQQIPVN